MIEIPDIMDFVGAWPPFERLTRDQLRRLCGAITVSYERVDSELLAFGAANDELLVIRKGAVGMYDRDGRLVDQRAEGGLIGYPSLLTGQPTRLAAKALEDTLVYRIPGALVDEQRRANPDFDRYFLARLSERVSSGLALRSDEALTSKNVGAFMSSPVIAMDENHSVGEAAALMTERRVSALAITAHDTLVGILTDRDFRQRVVTRRRAFETPIAEVMTRDPVACKPEDSVLQAQVLMLERGVHHLPVQDNGRLVGMLTLSDLLRARNSDPVYFIGDLKRAACPAELAEAAANRYALFASLVHGGVDSVHVMRIMTAITDATTSRLLQLAEAQLGAPPLPYAWVCLGSQARREQTGRTDQDNGLVLAREPSASESDYFQRLATYVCTGLDDAGFVFCPGKVMAMNPDWRMSVAAWQARFRAWIAEPEPEALMFASIFFDQRCAAGMPDLVAQVRRDVFARAKDNSLFLAHMAGNALAHRPPMSFFRRFIVEDDGQHHEGLNLKHRGVVPIVALARLKALALGIEAPETDVRLRLAAKSASNDGDMADLIDAMDLINRIRHEEQARQVAAGETLTNLVPPASLSPLTRRHLKAAFAVVRRAQANLARHHSIA